MQGTRGGNVFGVWEVKQVATMGGGGVGSEAKEGERDQILWSLEGFGFCSEMGSTWV